MSEGIKQSRKVLGMVKLGHSLDRFVGRLASMGGLFASAAIMTAVFMITTGVIARYVFERPMIFVDEYAGYLNLIIIFMGLAYAGRMGAHINVPLVVKRLPKNWRSLLGLIGLLLALLLFFIYLWYDCRLSASHVLTGKKAYTVMQTPLWIPEMFVLIGLTFALVEIIARIVKSAVIVKRGDSKES